MNRIPLAAQERNILGKKVSNLRKLGLIPSHVFGNKLETAHISVQSKEFLKVYAQAGETGLIDLTIGNNQARPVLIRNVQLDPVRDEPLHIDFYQVNLTQKVSVQVPIEIIGDQPEVVISGEAVVIQPIGEIEVEALPADLPESIQVDISTLKQIDDAILVSQLVIPQGVAILADPEMVAVKLDNAVTEEMKKLMEEQAAETAAAQATVAAEEEAGGEEVKEVEGETIENGGVEGGEEAKPAEEKTDQPA